MVGLSVAWLLLRRGHGVTLVDPCAAGPQQPGSGSSAALGLLMAQVYRRSSGRGWRLRQRSHQLWGEWRRELSSRGYQLPWRPGLLQLAADSQEVLAQQRLVEHRVQRGIALQWLSRDALAVLQPSLPAAAQGGVLSPEDGQLDPLPMLGALRADGLRLGLELMPTTAVALERPARGGGDWRVALAEGPWLQAQWLVICAGLGSPALLAPLGHERPQAPVLGQALELQLPAGCPDTSGWPGSISWNGINLVPRANGRLWLGATVEPDSDKANAQALAELRLLGGQAPAWLEQATVLQQWQGLRARPCGRPAPLLEQLEPGLLLASGHYRNGVLLAPASAEWVAEKVETNPQV